MGLLGAGLSGGRSAVVASRRTAAEDPAVGGVAGRPRLLRARPGLRPLLHPGRRGGAHRPRVAVRRRGLPGRAPGAGGRPCTRLPGRHDPGRGRPPGVAVRRPAHRRGVPGPGRRAVPRGGADRRSARPHVGRLRGRGGLRGTGPGGHPGGTRRACGSAGSTNWQRAPGTDPATHGSRGDPSADRRAGGVPWRGSGHWPPPVPSPWSDWSASEWWAPTPPTVARRSARSPPPRCRAAGCAASPNPRSTRRWCWPPRWPPPSR